MKVTSKLVEFPRGNPKQTYPCLLVNQERTLVVLFTGPKTGTVVFTCGGHHPIGRQRGDWCMDSFTQYAGNVEIGTTP